MQRECRPTRRLGIAEKFDIEVQHSRSCGACHACGAQWLSVRNGPTRKPGLFFQYSGNVLRTEIADEKETPLRSLVACELVDSASRYSGMYGM